MSDQICEKQEKHSLYYFLNAEIGVLLPLQDLVWCLPRLEYITYGNFLILVNEHYIHFYELIRGTFITKINLIVILEEVDTGSSVILGTQHTQ